MKRKLTSAEIADRVILALAILALSYYVAAPTVRLVVSVFSLE